MFIDCLGASGTVLEVIEGQSLESTCIYAGFPLPSLQCVLLDANGQLLSIATGKSVTNKHNVTASIILSGVPRTAKTVSCKAYHAKTNTIRRIRPVMVFRKYHRMLYCFFFLHSFVTCSKHIFRSYAFISLRWRVLNYFSRCPFCPHKSYCYSFDKQFNNNHMACGKENRKPSNHNVFCSGRER